MLLIQMSFLQGLLCSLRSVLLKQVHQKSLSPTVSLVPTHCLVLQWQTMIDFALSQSTTTRGLLRAASLQSQCQHRQSQEQARRLQLPSQCPTVVKTSSLFLSMNYNYLLLFKDKQGLLVTQEPSFAAYKVCLLPDVCSCFIHLPYMTIACIRMCIIIMIEVVHIKKIEPICITAHCIFPFYTAEATIEVTATTARFTWPLVSSSQTSVPGYIIDVQAIEPVGIDQIEQASIAPQENTELFTNLEEGVRYRFCLYALPPTPVGSAIINQHKGEFTTDSAGR